MSTIQTYLNYTKLRHIAFPLAVLLAVAVSTLTPLAPKAHADHTAYTKYSWSSSVYLSYYVEPADAEFPSSSQYVSAASYAAAGYPAVTTVGWVPGSVMEHNRTNPNDIYLKSNVGPTGGQWRHLSYAEFVATGKSRNVIGDSGIYFVKRTGSAYPSIYKLYACSSGKNAQDLSLSEWLLRGQPAPKEIDSLFINYTGISQPGTTRCLQ